MASFNERLKNLRSEKKLLQKELADKLDIPRNTISSWEAGYRIPELNTAEKLADFFEVSIDYLLGRSDIRNSNTQNPEIEELLKVDPDLLIEICRAKQLPDEERRRIKDFVAFEIENFLNEQQRKKNGNNGGKT